MNPQYVHHSPYGNHGGTHEIRPQYMIHGDGVYATRYNQGADLSKPLYTIRNNKWYATEAHPIGKSDHALYEMRGDKVHTTTHNCEHNPHQHTFEIKS